MKLGLIVATLAFVGLAAAPACAGCRDDVDGLDKQARDKSTSAMAHASGGQGVAAQREASKSDKPPMAVGDESQGDSANQAQVAINDARVALGKGDEAGCEAAVAKAKQQLAK